MSHEEATRILLQSRGKHFEPDTSRLSPGWKKNFVAIAQRYSNGD
jgi:hypothetical protein